jgi:putative transposase
MARMARAVAPGMPHHITQRGNRRQQTFFNAEDSLAYLDLMATWCIEYQVEIWAYCLMPNHVHLIAVPTTKDGLARAIGEAHRRYTRRVNFREGWRGHLWQERFSSFVMDEQYLLACARYIELNPVRAGLVEKPDQWRWSSARPHVKAKDDSLVTTQPLLQLVKKPWKWFLMDDVTPGEIDLFRRHERTGRPLGSESFVSKIENQLKRRLRPKKPGPSPKDK